MKTGARDKPDQANPGDAGEVEHQDNHDANYNNVVNLAANKFVAPENEPAKIGDEI
jgi:hypothetical protein